MSYEDQDKEELEAYRKQERARKEAAGEDGSDGDERVDQVGEVTAHVGNFSAD